MAAVKELFDQQFLQRLATELKLAWPAFEVDAFLQTFADHRYQNLELKQRMGFIAEQMRQFLPSDYAVALPILEQVCIRIADYKYVIFPEFVARFGLDDYARSVPALALMTQYSTSEFAVRPFIEKYPEQMMAQMLAWTRDDNEHVRRLASEGCRPRLPWASFLQGFIDDPTPLLAILEALRFDLSAYVRKSVANNLNDIAKDHPQLVLAIAERWLQHPQQNRRLVSHALRTLLKQGNQQALALMGFSARADIQLSDFIWNSQLQQDEALAFAFTLRSERQSLGAIRLEFAISFARRNRRHSRKVFRLSQADYQQSEKYFSKTFPFKPISSRRYYPGEHRLEILVNGVVLADAVFVRY